MDYKCFSFAKARSDLQNASLARFLKIAPTQAGPERLYYRASFKVTRKIHACNGFSSRVSVLSLAALGACLAKNPSASMHACQPQAVMNYFLTKRHCILFLASDQDPEGKGRSFCNRNDFFVHGGLCKI